MKVSKTFFLSFLFALFLASCTKNRFPEKVWYKYSVPEEVGFSSEKLELARDYSNQIGSAAVMVIYDGAVLVEWGDIDKRYMCHSVRKSYLSALYGIHVGEGNIDLEKTMAELNIDDDPPLTDIEKQARVRDLLKSRSGIYHTAAYETPAMKKRRPKRGSHKPGTYFYYNNWDFNTLGAIFEQETGSTIFEEFKNRIAIPLQMQDFRLQDTYYHLEKCYSIYPAYPFRMSARDMARFGLLYLREGKWKNKQIVPKEWIKESTTSYSRESDYSKPNSPYGYTYLWRRIVKGPFEKFGMYSAKGYGGHSIDVLPGANLVFVHRVDTWWDIKFSNCNDREGKKVSNEKRLKLIGAILDARILEPKNNPQLIPLPGSPEKIEIVKLESSILDKCAKEYEFEENFRVSIKNTNGNLLISIPGAGKFSLLPLSKTKFLMEDVEIPVFFEFDDNESPRRITIEFTPGVKCHGQPVLSESDCKHGLE